MKTIKLGKKNDASVYAIKDHTGKYFKMDASDLQFETPDAKIYFDAGMYPGITDIDQYMCDKADGQ